RNVNRRCEEAQLHPNQQVGEHNADDSGQQFRTAMAELEPGDGNVPKHVLHSVSPQTSITTSARALESPATLAPSSEDSWMRTSTTRASMSATGSLLKITLRLTTRSLPTTTPDNSTPRVGTRILAGWPALTLPISSS